jgi:hypothetical protein
MTTARWRTAPVLFETEKAALSFARELEQIGRRRE